MAHILVATILFDLNQGGGTIRIASDICRSLVRNGHQVSVLCYDNDGTLPVQEDCEGISIYRYRLANRRPGMALPLDHRRAARQLLADKLASRPDAIHGHAPFQFLAAVDAFPTTPSRVYTVHSPVTEEMQIVWEKQGWRGFLKRSLGLPLIRRVEAECFRHATVITALSDFTIGLINSLYGPETAQRVVKIPGWTDLTKFRILDAAAVAEARKKLGWPLAKPVLFALRRLEPRMGLENLLLASAELRAQGLQFSIMIGGKGSMTDKLTSLCSQLQLDDTVSFMGFVPEEALPDAYGACDASIVPTTALECFGIIVLESLACGRPTLVTPIGALPELVASVEPRWIAGGTRSQDLAALLGAFLRGDLPQHSQEAVRAFVDTQFNLREGIQAIENVLLAPRIPAK